MTSLPTRALGVVRAPRTTLAGVVTQPVWADVLFFTTIVVFACNALFLSTGVGQLALLDQWERTAQAFGGAVTDADYARLQDLSTHGVAYAALMAIVSGPVMVGAIAAVLLGVLRAMRSVAVTYRQLLAIVAHAGVILALRQVITSPLNYAFESMASPTTLVRFAGVIDEGAPLARFLSAIDMFVIWWIVVLAVGVGTLARRPARPLALAFAGAYVALALLLAAAMALTGGTA